MRNASGHNYWNSSFIIDVAMGQIPRSTERISSVLLLFFIFCLFIIIIIIYLFIYFYFILFFILFVFIYHYIIIFIIRL